MLPFEFVVDGPPVSAQTRWRQRRREWEATVAQAARRRWSEDADPVTAPVLVEVNYFYEGTSANVDNMIKPIQDALKGLIYMDDEQVTGIVGRKRDLGGNLRIENVSEVLAEGFDRGREFPYVVIREAPDQETL